MSANSVCNRSWRRHLICDFVLLVMLMFVAWPDYTLADEPLVDHTPEQSQDVVAVVDPFINYMPKQLLDPAFLGRLQWNNPDELRDIAGEWPAPETQTSGLSFLLGKKEIKDNGGSFWASYLRYKDKDQFHMGLSYFYPASEKDSSFFDKLLKQLTEAWGKPTVFADTSALPKGENPGYLTMHVQWDFELTRIQLLAHCDNAQFAMAMISIEHRDNREMLRDLIYIKCVTTRHVGVGNAANIDYSNSQVAQPFVIILDPNLKQLLRRDKYPPGKTTTFTDEKVIVEFSAKGYSFELEIDRLTATFVLAMRLPEDPETGSNQSGDCVKIDSKPKF